MPVFYHQEAPVLAATEQCSEPKPGVSQARGGQRRARVKPGGHRGGGRIGRREAPTNKQGLDGRFVQA